MVHEGHRKRLKKRFLNYGIESFELHQILELMLFYAIPRRDTNAIAHQLLEKCGSFSAVFDAPIQLLTKIPGITESVGIYIKMISEVFRIYNEDKFSHKSEIFDLRKASKSLALKLIGRKEECIAIILLDAKGKIVFNGVISSGSVNTIGVCSRRIIELISNYVASGILLAHNHPSGIAVPSKEDLFSTRKLKKIFDTMNVCFLDHIIVADDDYVSMRESGITEIFNDNF